MKYKAHWDKIFLNKPDEQKSWFQHFPETSMQFFHELQIPESAAIIDVGGGDSRLADALLNEGYTDITVLDISAVALEKAKARLGEKADKIKWIVSDVLKFSTDKKYDFWRDRAVFHFLTKDIEIDAYKRIMYHSIADSGRLLVGTFSEKGPETCSGLPVKRYSQQTLCETLSTYFKKIKCITVNHQTPFDSIQSFTFCSFLKNPSLN